MTQRRTKVHEIRAIVVTPRPSIWQRLFTQLYAWMIGDSKADLVAAAQLERSLRIAAERDLAIASTRLDQVRQEIERLEKAHVEALATLRLVAFGRAHGMTHQQAIDRGLILLFEDPVDTKVIAW
jgi:hypothetical protein